MSDPTKNARSLFSEAVENVPRQQWPEFLDTACGENLGLRKQVQRLLDAR